MRRPLMIFTRIPCKALSRTDHLWSPVSGRIGSLSPGQVGRRDARAGGHFLHGFSKQVKSRRLWKADHIATRCRASFHTRRLGLMSSHNAAERFWRPLEGLRTATISLHKTCLRQILGYSKIAESDPNVVAWRHIALSRVQHGDE